MIQLWTCDWGQFEIPADVPIAGNMRKDGWFDGRRKMTAQLRAYFGAQAENLRHGQSIQSWGEWMVAP